MSCLDHLKIRKSLEASTKVLGIEIQLMHGKKGRNCRKLHRCVGVVVDCCLICIRLQRLWTQALIRRVPTKSSRKPSREDVLYYTTHMNTTTNPALLCIHLVFLVGGVHFGRVLGDYGSERRKGRQKVRRRRRLRLLLGGTSR